MKLAHPFVNPYIKFSAVIYTTADGERAFDSLSSRLSPNEFRVTRLTSSELTKVFFDIDNFERVVELLGYEFCITTSITTNDVSLIVAVNSVTPPKEGDILVYDYVTGFNSVSVTLQQYEIASRNVGYYYFIISGDENIIKTRLVFSGGEIYNFNPELTASLAVLRKKVGDFSDHVPQYIFSR